MGKIEEVVSVNFVGSFLRKKNYSDIDIVIITKIKTKDLIKKCHNEIKKINYKSYGVIKKVIINDTFGPLKFNTEKNLVFHLMIYSIKDHVQHVLNSPFTCFDWERTNSSYGMNLRDIYPVSKIFISDFFSKNRGVNIYKKNLLNKKINYKKFFFKDEKVLTKNLNYKMNGKDIYEFCYHVISFTIKNYLKYSLQINKDFSLNDILIFINNLYKGNKLKTLIQFYKKLVKFKENGEINFDQKEAINISLNFLNQFENFIKKKEYNCINLDFKRHFKTKYNKQIFLGQKINPPILKKKHIRKKTYDILYTSPSLRCVQTTKLYSGKYIVSKMLKEIDYGNVEGLTFKELAIKYPNIINGWKEKKDVKFPKGESSKDVSKRVMDFLKFSKKFEIKKKYLITTHNVFLRCLLGYYFNIPISNWHLIKIGYGESIKFKIINKLIFINITRQKYRKFLSRIYENSISN